MSQPIPLSTFGPVQTIAFAGTDLHVHLVCQSSDGQLTSLTLNYPVFSRLLRERANRREAIAVLDAFRGQNLLDTKTGNRQWTLLDVRSIIGCALRLEKPSAALETPLQSAA